MSTVLIRLLTLNAENVIPEVIWALMGIYVLAMLLTLTSVWVTYRGALSRIFWILVVVGVPFGGIVAHCLHSLTLADVSSLKQFGFFPEKPPEAVRFDHSRSRFLWPSPKPVSDMMHFAC